MRSHLSLLLIGIGLAACSAKVDAPAVDLGGGSQKVTKGPNDTKVHVPAAGSYVTYDGKIGAMTYHEESRTIRLSQDSIWVVNHLIKNGDNTVLNEQDYRSGLYSYQSYQNMMDQCEKWGGGETIAVAAGIFRTCKVSVNGDVTWYGNVPIDGIVKFARKNGATAELTDLSYGPANN